MLVERSGRDGWAIASADGVTVALSTALDDELRREGRVYELIHRVNSLRKESGLALTDRIALTIPASDADLLEHAEWIKAETLATSLEADGDDALRPSRRLEAGQRRDSASASSRRSSTGRRNVTSSSTML